MINLIEIASKAHKTMRKEEKYIDGINMAVGWLEDNKIFNGSYIDCIQYLNGKITIASLNAINNPDYIGCIALYSAMIDELTYYAREKD